jgi:tetratricopeptide (TPR) repeat protein
VKDLTRKFTAKVGLLTAFDGRTALSAYCSELAAQLPCTLLAEDCADDSAVTVPPGCKVIRCWERNSPDTSRLRAAFEQERFDAVHLQLHKPFFPAASLLQLLQAWQQRGTRILVEIHDPELIDANALVVLRQADVLLVHDRQCEHELLAQGFHQKQICVLGPVVPEIGKQDAGTRNVPEKTTPESASSSVLLLVSSADDPAIRLCVQAVADLRRGGANVSLCILPLSSAAARSEAFLRLQQESASQPFIRCLEPQQGLPQAALTEASAVVIASEQPYFETSRALMLALASGKAVIAAGNGPFLPCADSVLHPSSRLPLAAAVQAVIRQPDLRQRLEQSARTWAAEHPFSKIAEMLQPLYEQRSTETAPTLRPGILAAPPLERYPRILMQCRENAYSQPGGDTVVMDRVSEGLRARGITVDVDLTGKKNLRDYDLVHLFNFALKDSTERLAKQCMQAGVPYVVTTMYEDWPLFYNQMNALCSAFQAYVESGQDRAVWQQQFQQAAAVRPSPIWDNSLTANNAAALIATGRAEADALRRDYPAAKRIEIYPCGAEVSDCPDGGEMFRRATGLEDFILCVGRFEVRKNQFMLLKALEDSDLTLVFAGGGFSYQPQYAELCRKFKRRGKTVFLDRLDAKLLSSAFYAARVHALPGWLELPGIVSLEAAQAGANVVVSDYGTVRDYLSDLAYYCRPGDPESIYNSVMAAFYSPRRPELQERARTFTWDRAAVCSGRIYQQVLESRKDLDWSFLAEQRVSPKSPEEGVQAGIERASLRAKDAGRSVGMIPVVVGQPEDELKKIAEAEQNCSEGDRVLKAGNLDGAKKFYLAAIQLAPNYARAYRSCGVIALNENRFHEAEEFFQQALRVDPSETRSMLGLGSVKWEQGQKTEAFDCYLKAAKQDPADAVTILHLVRTAYSLDRLRDLEQALRAFLKTDPDNINILYCLAGCSFRRGRLFLANGVVDRILKLDPDNAEAKELKEKITEEQVITRRRSATNAVEVSSAAEAEPAAQAPNAASQAIDQKLLQLDEAKRRREYESVLRGADEISRSSLAQPAQRALADIIRAEALACSGDMDTADDILRRIEDERLHLHRVLAARGAVAAARNSWTVAEDYFRQSLKHAQNFDTALAGLGLCAIQESKNEEAWDYFQAALKSNPENLRAVYGIIQLGYTLNRLEETKQALENYLDHHPVDLSINYTYAGCCYALGDRDKAEAELRKILLFEPDHALALELLEKIRMDAKEVVHSR